jgi:RNA polymerase sigma factor (sigma-70 family)
MCQPAGFGVLGYRGGGPQPLNSLEFAATDLPPRGCFRARRAKNPGKPAARGGNQVRFGQWEFFGMAEETSADNVIRECSMEATVQALAQGQEAPERVLVKNTCAFLKQRLQRLAPDAVLTHAWDSFYRTYTNILRRMAGEFHLDAGESEDLVQEVWATVIVHLSEFNWQGHGSGLRGWLYTLIQNKALNLIRQKVRHPVRLAGGMEMHQVADRTPGPAEQWEAHWDRELMHLLLAELEKKVSPVNHRLLILRWIEDRPLAEVARLLKLSEKQVTYRQQRLFRKLRAARALYRGEPFGASRHRSPSGR